MFCRELCEVTIFERRERLEGPGKVVEINESKIGKRKFHHGHVLDTLLLLLLLPMGFRRNGARFPEMLYCDRRGQNGDYTRKPYSGVGRARNDNCQ